MSGLEIVALLGFAALAYWLIVIKERRLADPTNTSTIYIDEMPSNHQLRAGEVGAMLYRQSGNEYRDLGIFDGSEAALAEVMKSFRRAGIESVAVLRNDETGYRVVRLHHSHDGRSEGKKLGGALLLVE